MRAAIVASAGVVVLTLTAIAITSVGSSTPAPAADYPDAITLRLHRMATEPRPVEGSAMPPRHLDAAVFPRSLVDRTQIVWGGRAPDDIPAIDDPVFEEASTVDWLDEDEAVLILRVGDVVRVYPVQVMIWHEVVNDVVDGTPIVLTYCPLCNSAVAFERATDGSLLDFGTSGSLYRSALVMYDRQTESLWTQFDGQAVIGSLVGTSLEPLPVATVSWRDAVTAHPDAAVLTAETGARRSYGRNPYVGYDSSERPLTGFFTGAIDGRLPPMARVVGAELPGGAAIAMPTDALAARGVVAAESGGRRVVVWHLPGTASALDDALIADGRDVGATGVFDAGPIDEAPTFARVDGGFVDDRTGSTWNVLGEAVAGPLTGARLQPIPHLDTFWFAWSAHRPATIILEVPDHDRTADRSRA